MRAAIAILCFSLILACGQSPEYRIEVPQDTRVTAESILTELEEKAEEEPKNQWLLNQQLYFCDQMDWPLRCERALNRARAMWGLTDRLIDMYVDFYEQQGSIEQLEGILQGAVETRERLEVRLRISASRKPFDDTYLKRYTERHTDLRAQEIIADVWLRAGDSSRAVAHFLNIVKVDPAHRALRRSHPLLMEHGEWAAAEQILRAQLADRPDQPVLQRDLAVLMKQKGKPDTAKFLLRQLGNDEAFGLLTDWFQIEGKYDSALFYHEKTKQDREGKKWNLTKAKLLEQKGWLTASLPYYEQSLALDTADLELRQHVEIVRRKVAYLRQIREQETSPPPPNLERKTLGN